MLWSLAAGRIALPTDIDWKKLCKALADAPLPTSSCWEPKYPSGTASPLYAEGYYLWDSTFKGLESMSISGVELRTFPHDEIADAIDDLANLFKASQECLIPLGLVPLLIGGNPDVYPTELPLGPRSFTSLRIAEIALAYASFHVNISLDQEQSDEQFSRTLERLWYYAPAIAAFSFNSPTCSRGHWKNAGSDIKSHRSFSRSFYVDPITRKTGYFGLRYEFSLFDAVSDLSLMAGLMQIAAGLLLSEVVVPAEPITVSRFNLIQAAKHGWETDLFNGRTHDHPLVDRANEAIQVAANALREYGIFPQYLGVLSGKLDRREMPADKLEEALEPPLSIEMLPISFTNALKRNDSSAA